MNEKESSYIDYEAFLSPSFSASVFANSIVLGTNNPSDVPLDLSTPLSKVLFDAQEINDTLDTLTSKYALPLLNYTQEKTTSSANLSHVIDSQISSLNDSYKRLEKEVIERYASADEVRVVCERLWETARLGRSVVRCLQWGRQLEIQLAEIIGTGIPAKSQGPKDDHVTLVRCSNTILSLHELLSSKNEGDEGHGLDRVEIIKTLQSSIVNPGKKLVLTKSQQIIRDFSVTSQSSSSAFTLFGEIKAKTVSALISLYLLSLTTPTKKMSEKWEPEYLVNTLQEYLQAALSASLVSLYRALTTLPTLDRILIDISFRCQNIVMLESILSNTGPPTELNLFNPITPSPLLTNFLQPLLSRLETNSLPSWFWRSLASGLSSRLMDFVSKGGASVRALRNNRNSVKDAIRECVIRGTQMPGRKDTESDNSWEREIAVMIGSISGPLARFT